jgi:hypothetical protein
MNNCNQVIKKHKCGIILQLNERRSARHNKVFVLDDLAKHLIDDASVCANIFLCYLRANSSQG